MQDFDVGDLLVRRYEVTRVINRAEKSAVFLTKDTQNFDKKVVVKLLVSNPEEQDTISTARFKTEILATYNINHPNVIKSYNYHEEGNLIAFAMEYLAGGDLADLLSTGHKIPPAQITIIGLN